MKKHLQFNESISYQLVYKNIKNMWMRLNNKNEIIVTVPINVNDEIINKFINQHIHKFINLIENRNTNNSINIEENFFYLFGQKIFFELSIDQKRIILHNSKKLLIGKKSITETIENYRKKELKTYLIVKQLQFQKFMDVPNHLIYVRDKATAWATNHVLKKKIFYSTNLAPFSKDTINYVIVHELSHNKFSNHSKDFWNYVKMFEPDFKNKKLKLKKNIYN